MNEAMAPAPDVITDTTGHQHLQSLQFKFALFSGLHIASRLGGTAGRG
jgi:hypothetical protein